MEQEGSDVIRGSRLITVLFLLLFCAVVFMGCRHEESDRLDGTVDRGWMDTDTAAEKYGLMIYETPSAEALSGETKGADMDALDHRAVSVGNSVFFLHNVLCIWR